MPKLIFDESIRFFVSKKHTSMNSDFWFSFCKFVWQKNLYQIFVQKRILEKKEMYGASMSLCLSFLSSKRSFSKSQKRILLARPKLILLSCKKILTNNPMAVIHTRYIMILWGVMINWFYSVHFVREVDSQLFTCAHLSPI